MKTIGSQAKGRTTRQSGSKRELIDTGRDKRLVRRDGAGRFKESDDLGRSLAQDRRRKAKSVSTKGQGDRGDRAQPARRTDRKG